MPEANQSTEKTRVTSIVVERLFNLGNYENIKYGVRVEIAEGDDPGGVLVSLEGILNDLRAKSGVGDYELRKAKRILETPEDQLDDYEKGQLDQYRELVEKRQRAAFRRLKAREALSTLNYTVEHKDHKKDWDDDGFEDQY